MHLNTLKSILENIIYIKLIIKQDIVIHIKI